MVCEPSFSGQDVKYSGQEELCGKLHGLSIGTRGGAGWHRPGPAENTDHRGRCLSFGIIPLTFLTASRFLGDPWHRKWNRHWRGWREKLRLSTEDTVNLHFPV